MAEKNNPIIRVHRDFADWLNTKAEELHIEKVPLTKIIELKLSSEPPVKINTEDLTLRRKFVLKTFK